MKHSQHNILEISIPNDHKSSDTSPHVPRIRSTSHSLRMAKVVGEGGGGGGRGVCAPATVVKQSWCCKVCILPVIPAKYNVCES